MAMTKPLLTLVLATFATTLAAAPLPPGQKPVPVTLQGDDGGQINGTPWSSSMIKDKVWVLFYVDPDKRDTNEAMEAALKKANLPSDKFSSIAVINMAATWLPNAVIASSLKAKQEKYPDVVYVKDLDKVLVKKWKLTDDEYDVMVFDKQGKVVYSKDGTLDQTATQSLLATIRKNL